MFFCIKWREGGNDKSVGSYFAESEVFTPTSDLCQDIKIDHQRYYHYPVLRPCSSVIPKQNQTVREG